MRKTLSCPTIKAKKMGEISYADHGNLVPLYFSLALPTPLSFASLAASGAASGAASEAAVSINDAGVVVGGESRGRAQRRLQYKDSLADGAGVLCKWPPQPARGGIIVCSTSHQKGA